jgi:hypothetical protein
MRDKSDLVVISFVSHCCGAEMIPPDEEAAEKAGSLCWAYLCYICKEFGKACEPVEKNKTNIMENKKLYLISTIRLGDFYVIAETATEAQTKLEEKLSSISHRSYSEEVVNIKILSRENLNSDNDIIFSENKRLVL